MPENPISAIDQQLRSVLDSIARIEASAKQKDHDDRLIKWITLSATIVSTILIAGLTAYTTYRLGEQTRVLQEATAIQSQIHDLSSEDANVRYGAERYLSQTQYADLVLRQATQFGDVEILGTPAVDRSIHPEIQQKYKDAEGTLSQEMDLDKRCFKGHWQERDRQKPVLREWKVEIVAPRRLQLSRPGEDGGLFVRARRIDKNLWLDPQFSWGGAPPGPLEFVTNDDCSVLDSSRGWHLYKLPASKPATGVQQPSARGLP